VALAWFHLPLGAAILCWGISFTFGCLHLQYNGSVLWNNFDLIKVQRGEHELLGNHPEAMAIGDHAIRRRIKAQSVWAARYDRWQFWLLVAGAALYVGWHIFAMYLRR
jgi:hypothetical protein